jgi:hypothetical protein
VSDAGERLAEKGKGRLGAVQSVGPAAERGRIGHAIRVFERRHRLLPRTMLHKAPPQSLTARQQTVVGVRERKQWKKSESLPATCAVTPTDPNPVMMRMVRPFAATPMPDDGIAFTTGAAPQDDFGAARGPLCFELVRRDRKWDKQNRSSLGALHSGLNKNPTGENTASPTAFLGL